MAILERRTDIDILFADVVMPKGMSGLQLAYLSRRDRARRRQGGHPYEFVPNAFNQL